MVKSLVSIKVVNHGGGFFLEKDLLDTYMYYGNGL